MREALGSIPSTKKKKRDGRGKKERKGGRMGKRKEACTD
jgi:hypothetical protein